MNRSAKFCSTLIFLALLPLVSCAQKSTSVAVSTKTTVQKQDSDFSCSYFYFLWGTHAEFSNRYSEALDAYEKALVCDPDAEYIKEKLPLLHLKKGDSSEAIRILEQAIAENPQSTLQRSLLARIYIREKEEDKAIEQYKAILAYEPEDSQTLLSLGVLLSQTGDLPQARTYFDKLLQLDRDTYFAHVYLARIAVDLEDFDTAELHYTQAIDLNWSDDLAYEIAEYNLDRKQYEKAIEIMRKVLDSNDSDERARLTIVQAQLALGQKEAAIRELSHLKQYSSTPEQTALILSKLYLRNNNPDKAITTLSQLLAHQESGEARYMLGVAYAEQEEYQKALDSLAGINADQDTFEDSVYLRIKILHQNDRIDEAIEILKNYLSEESTRKPLFYILAASLYQDSGKPQQGVDLLAEGTSFFPDNEQLLFEYGINLERTDELEKALEVMEQVLRINPDHAEALNFVGYTWADTNRNLDQALQYITRAMELKPGNGYIQDSLGWAHYRLGNLEQARIELLDALQLLPDDPHVHDHLGDVYRDLGFKDKALASYQNAIERFEDETNKQKIRKKIEALEVK